MDASAPLPLDKSPTLEKLPPKLVKTIVEKSGFMAINCLTLVNHTFKNFIEEVEPKYHIGGIIIEIHEDRIVLKLEEDKNAIEVQYQRHNQGTRLVQGATSKIRQNVTYVDVFGKDLSQILSRQEPTLDKFWLHIREKNHSSITIDTAFRRLRDILKGQKSLLRAKEVFVEGNAAYMMEILPFTDATTVYRILLNQQNEDFDEAHRGIMEMDHWKNAKELHLHLRRLNSFPIEKLIHFSVLNLFVWKMTWSQLNLLKKGFAISLSFKNAFIRHFYLLEQERLPPAEVMQQRNNTREHYYLIPKTDFLFYHYHSTEHSKFVRAPQTVVPIDTHFENLYL